MHSLLEILNKTTAFFQKNGVPNARLDAEYLLSAVLDMKRMELYLNFEKPLLEKDLDMLRPLVKRRASREPLQYILGKAAFMDIELKVDKRALIPRPETEELIELISKEIGDKAKSILDLGTGTGAIACMLACQFPAAKITAVEKSQTTLEIANENISNLELSNRVKLISSDWFSNIEGLFDLVVSNPPYLAEKELTDLEPEVKNHEPISALVSGSSGIEAILKIIEQARSFIVDGGSLFFETGANQYEAIRSAVPDTVEITPYDDLAGKQRFLKINYLR